MGYPLYLQKAIEEFKKLPGIGPKTAERFVFYLLEKRKKNLENLVEAIKNLEKISLCKICGNYTSETSLCEICADPKREKEIICVVEKAQDILAIEKTQEFLGLYHVLGGLIDLTRNITPQDLRIEELIARIKKENPKEIILALNPTIEGETTILYLKKMLSPFKIKISRLARGLPLGAELDWADEITLSNSLKKREIIYGEKK